MIGGKKTNIYKTMEDNIHTNAYPKNKDSLTLKHRETHGRVVSTVATDALVLKHQDISIHNAD